MGWCSRFPSGTRDIIDWPEDSRDGYVMTNVTTVINAFAVGGLRALAQLAPVIDRAGDAQQLMVGWFRVLVLRSDLSPPPL